MSVSFQLSDEQAALRELAHDFAKSEIRPAAPHHDETGEYPHAVLKEAHKLGLMNTHVPSEYGGLGLGALDGMVHR
jgi:acyl-CoA dehydrogenase